MDRTPKSAPSPPWRSMSLTPRHQEPEAWASLLPDRAHVSPFHYPATQPPLARPSPADCSLNPPTAAPTIFRDLSMGWSFRMQLDELRIEKLRDAIDSGVLDPLPPSATNTPPNKALHPTLNPKSPGSCPEMAVKTSGSKSTRRFTSQMNHSRRHAPSSLLRSQGSASTSSSITAPSFSASDHPHGHRCSRISIPDILNPAPSSAQRHAPIWCLGSSGHLPNPSPRHLTSSLSISKCRLHHHKKYATSHSHCHDRRFC
ncbi:hypothetical protein D9757_003777 [Collybiopsis confluens]|uniref:Uncharacterized protein n=1 Tax=Collybiopsis confluens TaxID=2823264 RepID=A0A8H5HVQ2_9AGAR|nr:hypothetical protein D9757_003777 [Collybiopsis confluens]